MYSPFQLATRYLRYYVIASSGRGHGVHSPFVFDFIIRVLNDTMDYDCYEKIESIRKELSADHTVIKVEDFGAGSRKNSNTSRVVSDIAASALKPKKYAQLIFRIARYYKTMRMLELGTSLGITSSYLAASNPRAALDTFEGATSVASIAKYNFEKLGLQNIRLHTGNFDETVPFNLMQYKKVDLAFVDGNHRYEPTIRYFRELLKGCHNESILIFDDIHWSREMEQAWNEIKKDDRVKLTIDLFYIGLVFFKKEFKVKQHFTIRF